MKTCLASIRDAKDQIIIKRAVKQARLSSHMQHLGQVGQVRNIQLRFIMVYSIQRLSFSARRCGGTKKPGKFPAKNETLNTIETNACICLPSRTEQGSAT